MGGTYELTTMGLRYLNGELNPALLGGRATESKGPSPEFIIVTEESPAELVDCDSGLLAELGGGNDDDVTAVRVQVRDHTTDRASRRIGGWIGCTRQ
jgi:hypothetical protein